MTTVKGPQGVSGLVGATVRHLPILKSLWNALNSDLDREFKICFNAVCYTTTADIEHDLQAFKVQL